MKLGSQLISSFLGGVAQFIIGVLIISGKAGIYTIGWYYIVSSVVIVLVSIIAIAAVAYAAEKGK